MNAVSNLTPERVSLLLVLSQLWLLFQCLEASRPAALAQWHQDGKLIMGVFSKPARAEKKRSNDETVTVEGRLKKSGGRLHPLPLSR